MSVNPTYTEINVIITACHQAKVMVKDGGKSGPDACVEFKLWPPGGIPIPKETYRRQRYVRTDLPEKGGYACWASKDGRFRLLNFLLARLRTDRNPDKQAGDSFTVDIDIVLRRKCQLTPKVTSNSGRKMTADHDRRLISNAYVCKFTLEEAARNFARITSWIGDAAAKILVAARGNYRVIREFITRCKFWITLGKEE